MDNIEAPRVFTRPEALEGQGMGKTIFPGAPINTEKSPGQVDPRMIDVTAIVPSKGSVYPEGVITVRPFTVFEVQKIHRGLEEKAIRYEIDALGACINIDAYNLTLGDFYWLMYWERVNSYKRSPFNVTYRCSARDHVEKVVNGELEESTLENQISYTASELKEVPLDEANANAFAEAFHCEYGLYLDLPRIGDLIEEDEEKVDNGEKWFNRYAAVINRQRYGAKLKERRTFIKKWLRENSDPDILEEFEEWFKIIEHGVQEKIPVKCKECGVIDNAEVVITPLAFLPNFR